ncbi:hypothetical protein ACJJTC_017131 [Scirpophaga incertulas]
MEKSTSRTKVVLSQVIACLSLDCLLIGLGMSISIVTMVIPAVLEAPEGLSITKEQASWFGSMAFLFQPMGSIFSAPLLDYFGRKKALFVVNIPHVVAWIMIHNAWNVPTLFIGNALLGFGTGVMEAPSITYVGEISDPLIRGLLTTMTNSFTSLGIFMAYFLGSMLPWRQAALAALSIPLATMFFVLFVPETPVWLLSKGRQKEALRSLCRLRGWANPEDVKEEFDQLLNYNEVVHQCVICVREGKSQSRPCEHDNLNIFKKCFQNLKYVFFVRETLRPFILVIAYFFFHTMSGHIPVRSNMVNFCGALGMKYDSKAIVVVVGALFIVMNLITAVAVKVIGKRKLVLGSMLATTSCSLSISIYAALYIPDHVFSYEPATFPEPTDFMPIVLFFLLVCFSSLGIPWVLLSEVFPFRSRGMATSMSAAVAYIVFFLSSKTNYNIEASIHLSGTFAFYAAVGLIGTVYLYFFLPETEKKTLQEIEAFYKGNTRIFADDFFINSFRKKSSTDIKERERVLAK